ncbi:MAG: hypothetical protein QXR60_04675 [Candidatus Nanoarchaeia archaeon]
MVKNKERFEELKRIYKEKGLKAAFDKWRYNFVVLIQPEDLLLVKIIGSAGSCLFLAVSCVMLSVYYKWYVGVGLGFAALVQFAEFRGSLKQRHDVIALKKAAEQQAVAYLEGEEFKEVGKHGIA